MLAFRMMMTRLHLPIRIALPWELGLCVLMLLGSHEAVRAVDPESAVPSAGALHTFSLSIGTGEATYQESVTLDPIDSDWTSDYLRLGAAWTYSESRYIKFRMQGSYWFSGSENEDWTSGGVQVQENSLEVTGFDLRGEWGFDLFTRSDASSTAWLGLGLRGQDFDRSDFVLGSGEPTTLHETIGETYDIGYLSMGLEGWIGLTKELRAGAGLTGGWVFANEAHNDLLGSIEGSGGYLIEGRVSVEWAMNDRHAVVVGVFYDYQDLDGDRKSSTSVENGVSSEYTVEWPDNTLEQLGIELQWVYRL